MKKENMRTKKLRAMRKEQEKINKIKGIKPASIRIKKKPNSTNPNKKKPKVYGWNGDDEIYF